MNKLRDFDRSAKIVLNLVKSALLPGNGGDAQAQESIRMALCEASEVGRKLNAKLHKVIGDGR
jgi:hypothetical protein